MNFKDKVILITGASSGIGESCVMKLLEFEAKISGLDINPSKTTNKKYKHYVVDVRDEIGISKAVGDVEQDFKWH